jgi:glycerol-3-phosphate dehydrogenase (NAD(P)+)
MMEPKRIALLGDGGWGTALACVLAGNGHRPALWGAFPQVTEEIRAARENRKFLPGIAVPEGVALTNDMAAAVEGAEIVVFTTPVVYMRQVAQRAAPLLRGRRAGLLNVAKGIESDTLLLGSEIIAQAVGREVALLFGPSHAEEVARRLPTTVVAAARDAEFARAVQRAFMNSRFRVYTSDDVVGVEIGGAVKNVIAIAAGLCDGLGFGDNAKAALLTRGLAEIARLGVALGAKRETFSGLSGLGDLITTCVSPYGRNLKVGREIGKGKSVDTVLKEIAPMVPEGVWTTRSVCALAARHKVEMPISMAVQDVLFNNKPALQAAQELMTRDPKAE